MLQIARPRIVVSRCFGFEAVRYDGGIIKNNFVEKLKPYVDFLLVCPETGIGLKTPRKPLDIILIGDHLKLIQPTTGKDFTRKMSIFAENFLNSLDDIDGFILKSKSPSCAIRDAKIIPDGGGDPIPGKWPGFFAASAMKIKPFAVFEDELRLKRKTLREQFLIRIFSLASLRMAIKSRSKKSLRRFLTDNEMLVTAHLPETYDTFNLLLADGGGNIADDI